MKKVTLELKRRTSTLLQSSIRNDGTARLAVLAPWGGKQPWHVRVDADVVEFARVRTPAPPKGVHAAVQPADLVEVVDPGASLTNDISLEDLKEHDFETYTDMLSKNVFKRGESKREPRRVVRARLRIEAAFVDASRTITKGFIEPELTDGEVETASCEITLSEPIEVLAYRRSWW